jgi:MFS family permease
VVQEAFGTPSLCTAVRRLTDQVYWLLGPFTISSVAIGGIIIPKINLILSLICREYFADKSLLAAGLGELDPQCRTPEVQARVAHFTMWAGLISGVLSALTAPRLCALSDRWGRRPVMMICNAGSLFGEIMTIFAANFPETFPVHWILIGSFIDGMCGSMIASSAVVQSYATDCTPPSRRNIIFGQFQGCIFTGIAIGPLIAALIMKFVGNIIVMFYIALGCHLFFITLLVFFIPESLARKRQLLAREKHRQKLEARGPSNTWKSRIKDLNVFEPLKALYPKDADIPLPARRNLLLLSSLDGIIFGTAMGAMGAVVLYSQYKFQWDVATQSVFMSIVNSARVSCLVVVLPLITYLFRGKASSPNARPAPKTGVDRFELSIIRVAILFDMLGFLGFALARTGEMFIAAGTIASMGGIGSPTLQAALTKHVPPDRIGQLLGALGLLHAMARVAAPVVFNSIYAATVGKFDQTVFIILTALFGVAWVISWLVRPGG